MNVLTQDCMLSLAKHLEFHDIYNWSRSCKTMKRKVYDNQFVWLAKISDVITITSQMIQRYCLPKFYFYISMFNGANDAMIHACKCGDLAMLRYFHDQSNFDIIVELFLTSTEYGHLNIIKYLSSTIGCAMTKFLIET